ncbi:hypothetical protein IPM62_03405 [Candidatus Woesebacteria bacterium]|nr:MAG: hypothetical protein IPM62_03405 [Candidatus Woesebacteria bacterium]
MFNCLIQTNTLKYLSEELATISLIIGIFIILKFSLGVVTKKTVNIKILLSEGETFFLKLFFGYLLFTIGYLKTPIIKSTDIYIAGILGFILALTYHLVYLLERRKYKNISFIFNVLFYVSLILVIAFEYTRCSL